MTGVEKVSTQKNLVPTTSRLDPLCPLVDALDALAGSRFLLIRFPCSGTADTNFPAGVQGYVLATRSIKILMRRTQAKCLGSARVLRSMLPHVPSSGAYPAASAQRSRVSNDQLRLMGVLYPRFQVCVVLACSDFA